MNVNFPSSLHISFCFIFAKDIKIFAIKDTWRQTLKYTETIYFHKFTPDCYNNFQVFKPSTQGRLDAFQMYSIFTFWHKSITVITFMLQAHYIHYITDLKHLDVSFIITTLGTARSYKMWTYFFFLLCELDTYNLLYYNICFATINILTEHFKWHPMLRKMRASNWC